MPDTNEIQSQDKNTGLYTSVASAFVLGSLGVGLQVFSGVETEVPGWMPNLPVVNAGLSILVAFAALLLFAVPKWYGADRKTMQDIGVGLAIYGFAQACGAAAVILASN